MWAATRARSPRPASAACSPSAAARVQFLPRQAATGRGGIREKAGHTRPGTPRTPWTRPAPSLGPPNVCAVDAFLTHGPKAEPGGSEVRCLAPAIHGGSAEPIKSADVTTCDHKRMQACGGRLCRCVDTLLHRCAGKPGRRTCPPALGALMHLFRFRHHRRSWPQPPPGHEVVRLHRDLGLRNADATGRRLVRVIDRGPDVLEVDLTDVKYLSPDGSERSSQLFGCPGTWCAAGHHTRQRKSTDSSVADRTDPCSEDGDTRTR